MLELVEQFLQQQATGMKSHIHQTYLQLQCYLFSSFVWEGYDDVCYVMPT